MLYKIPSINTMKNDTVAVTTDFQWYY